MIISKHICLKSFTYQASFIFQIIILYIFYKSLHTLWTILPVCRLVGQYFLNAVYKDVRTVTNYTISNATGYATVAFELIFGCSEKEVMN